MRAGRCAVVDAYRAFKDVISLVIVTLVLNIATELWAGKANCASSLMSQLQHKKCQKRAEDEVSVAKLGVRGLRGGARLSCVRLAAT